MKDVISIDVLKKWIRWIPPIIDRFKLNFDGSRIQNKSVLGWVITYSDGIIKMAAYKYVGQSSIIVAECMTLKDDIQTSKSKGYSNLEIEEDSKIIIDCYNKRITIPSSIMVLMKDINLKTFSESTYLWVSSCL